MMKHAVLALSILFLLALIPVFTSAQATTVLVTSAPNTASMDVGQVEIVSTMIQSAFYDLPGFEVRESIDNLALASSLHDSSVYAAGWKAGVDYVASFKILDANGLALITLRLLSVQQRQVATMKSTQVKGGFANLTTEKIQMLVAQACEAVQPGTIPQPAAPAPQPQVQAQPTEPLSNSQRPGHPIPGRMTNLILAGVNLNLYKMDDLNNELAAWRSIGADIDGITKGIGFQFGIRFSPDDDVQFGFEYRKLEAHSSYSDADGTLSYDVGARVYEFVALLKLGGDKRASLFAGVGAGQYVIDGNVKLDVGDMPMAKGGITGQRVGFRPFLETQIEMDPNLRFALSMGYRFADIGSIRVADTLVEHYSLDYSGINVGATIIFVMKSGL